MSLLVDVFVREPDGSRRFPDKDAYNSGGFESWRTTVWGSDLVRSLGARLLPVLAERDLEVEHEQVPDLLREVALLRSHLDRIATGTDRPRSVREHRDQIEDRLRIIDESARQALEIGGGVIIW
ncbi:hypothetical protein AB0E81_28415 [Streptomyces sp. NPDC033538]|uniref:hypothetical protein n=1 Tax=Streptomyces sp. NPDC033538 TaxID=3155367 RepID=UPI0033EB28EA